MSIVRTGGATATKYQYNVSRLVSKSGDGVGLVSLEDPDRSHDRSRGGDNMGAINITVLL